MPWVGAAFQRTDGTRSGATVWQQAEAALVTVNAPDADTHDEDIAANGITECLHKGGNNAATANISWGGFKITNLGSATVSADAVNKGQMDAANAAQDTVINGKLGNVVEDTSPQLGGNLDVNGNSIVSVSGGNILITADGAGSITLTSGSGTIKLHGLTYPAADGNSGEVLTTDGAGGLTFQALTPSVISEEFVSAEQTITGNSTVTVAHGLASAPKLVIAYLICKTAEHNWVIDDIMHLPYVQNFGGTAITRGMTMGWDATNVYLYLAAGSGAVFEGHNKTTYARTTFTDANWRIVVKAYA